MIRYKKFLLINLSLIFILFFGSSFADNHNIYEILENIKKDLKTLEKAVYSDSENGLSSNSNTLDGNSEDVLTRHLLKLSDLEKQFQELTNNLKK